MLLMRAVTLHLAVASRPLKTSHLLSDRNELKSRQPPNSSAASGPPAPAAILLAEPVLETPGVTAPPAPAPACLVPMSLPADRTAAAAAAAAAVAAAVFPAPSDKLLLLLLLLSLSLSLPAAASLDSVPARPLSGIKLLAAPPELTAAAAAGQVAMACPKRGAGPDLSFTCVQRQVVVTTAAAAAAACQ